MHLTYCFNLPALTKLTLVMLNASLAAAAFANTPTAESGALPPMLKTVVVKQDKQPYVGNFKLLETPKAFSVISENQVDQQQITKLSEVLSLDASVMQQNNFGGLWDAYAIRGFAGDENLPSGYLINGYNAGRGFAGNRDVAGIKRVEILKGPNAALFGRGEPGGAVNIVSKKAELNDTYGDASLTVGQFNAYRAEGDVNVAVLENTALRLAGFVDNADSFRDHISRSRYGFFPALTTQLSDQLLLSYELEHSQQRQPFDRGTLAIDGQLGKIDRRTFLGEPRDGDITAKVTGHQLQLNYQLNDDWDVLLGGLQRDSSLKGMSTEAEFATNRQALFHVPGQQLLSRQQRYRDYDGRNQALRTELSGKFNFIGMQHRIMVGSDYDNFENDQVFRRFRPPVITGTTTNEQSNNINIYQPVYGAYAPKTLTLQADKLDTHKALGVYVQDHISINDQLDVRVGTRYDNFELDLLNRMTAITQQKSAHRLSSQLGIVYKTQPNLSLYGNVGEGFRANIGADFAGNIFAPETAFSSELGAKWYSAEQKLNANVGVFHMNKKNVLTADPLNSGSSAAIGRVQSQGLELDVQGKLPIARNNSVQLSYAYTDASVDQDGKDPNFSLPLKKGDRLINIPKHQANLSLLAVYQIAGYAVEFGGRVQHVAKRLGETGKTFTLPEYTLVHLTASTKLNPQTEMFAGIKNVLNTTYYSNSFSALWVQPGEPLTATMGVKFQF